MLERISNNAYKIDLPGEYNVSATFNVSDLSPFDVGDPFDSRTNPFEERENVRNIDAPSMEDEQDGKPTMEEGAVCTKKGKAVSNTSPISMPQGLITRSRAKKIQQALITHLQGMINSASEDLQEITSVRPNVTHSHINVFECHLVGID